MSSLIVLAKRLRKNATDTEYLLWKHLRAKRFANFKFRRQVPMGSYILDFVCFEKLIIIECDGGQHMEQKNKDMERDQLFLNQGYRIFRFWNHQILQELDIVLDEIYIACISSPPPNPLPQGEGE